MGRWWLRNRIQDWEWRRPTGRIQKACLGVRTGWLSSPSGPTTHLFYLYIMYILKHIQK